MAASTATAADQPMAVDPAPSIRDTLQGFQNRLKAGDTGPLPAILGLVVLGFVFTLLRPGTFLTPLNMANLLVQAGAICILAMGLVPVLLLGEIDLSAGVAGGVAAGVMATVFLNYHLGWYVAVPAALVAGLVIGSLIGVLVATIGVPSFVVTLGFFLGLQGINLLLIGQGGTVPVRDSVVLAVANRNVPPTWGWILCAAVVVLYAGTAIWQYQRRVAKNLVRAPFPLILARVVVVALIAIAVTALLNTNRARVSTITLAGIPWVVPLVILLLLAWTFVLDRTRWGRYLYAVGGSAEAARRAGISVTRMRISAFAMCTTMAAISGIVAASRLNSVTPDAGAGNTLLYAVGAAVIGGTSLFGGKGRARDAVIGGLVIATIDNGLGLLGLPSWVNYLVTCGVLLLAAGVDALTRRRRLASGR